MSLYVLDTDIVSLYQRGHPFVSQRCKACQKGELAVTVISVEEQLSGWYSLVRRPLPPPKLAEAYQSLADSVAFVATMPILPFSEPSIVRFEQLVVSYLD